MKIFSFEIENYRAIEKVKLNLSFSINPIIGVNESGKTTVLKAGHLFHKKEIPYYQQFTHFYYKQI